LYPGDIKGIYKNERSFIELEKILMKKGLSFIWILFPESKIENRRISDIMREKAKLNNR
jgi:hypothetical protein